jgi:hypothetical protein
LQAAGAEVHRGDLDDLDSLRGGATGMDAAVNLAFNHDFSKFAQSAANETKAIEALGSALDMPASSEWTRKTLGWEPSGPGLIEDLMNMKCD